MNHKNRISPSDITKLKKNQIFVFGSNADGKHAGGAAKLAAEKFNAKQGVARGRTGDCYAIDTMSGLAVIKEQIQPFIESAKVLPLSVFLVTEIGCGIAGYTVEQIAPLFEKAKDVDNIHLPQRFWDVILAPSVIKGYKAFDSNFKCRGFQYEEGKEYKMDGAISVCNRGFHFCVKLGDCFSYYEFSRNTIICEVEALGETQIHGVDSKICTNHLRIIKQLTWDEVQFLANQGLNNTGHSNTGDRNTGDRNTGDSNTGSWNTGYRNTGYSNTGDRNTGAFCTGEPTIKLFNKDSQMTHKQFEASMVFDLLCQVDTKMWIPDHAMSEEEKAANKGWKTAEGYFKDIPFKQAFTDKWNNWSDENRIAFTSLPNFDWAIFEEITGVKKPE